MLAAYRAAVEDEARYKAIRRVPVPSVVSSETSEDPLIPHLKCCRALKMSSGIVRPCPKPGKAAYGGRCGDAHMSDDGTRHSL